MIKRFGKGLLASLEDEAEVVPAEGGATPTEEPAPVEADPADEVLEAEESPEAGEAEIEKAEGELDDSADQMEELEQAAEELEDVEATLEAFLEDGGMNPQAALAMGVTMKRLKKNLGASPLDNMPSNEDFGTTASSRESTVASLEGVREVIQMVIKAITDAAEWVKTKFKQFWSWVFNTAGRMETRLKKQAEAAGKLEGDAKAEEISASGLSALTVGEATSASDVVRGMASASANKTGIPGVLKAFTDARVEDSKALTEGFRAAKAAGDLSEVSEGSVGNKVRSIIDELRKGAKETAGAKGFPKGYVVNEVTPVYPGDVKGVIGISSANADENIFSTLAGVRSGIVEADVTKPDNLETPTPSEIVMVLNTAADLARGVGAYKTDADKRSKAADDMLSAAKELVTSLKDGEEGDSKGAKQVRSVGKAISKWQAGANGMPEKLAKHALKVCKAASKYAAVASKQYEAGEGAAPDVIEDEPGKKDDE